MGGGLKEGVNEVVGCGERRERIRGVETSVDDGRSARLCATPFVQFV